MNAPKAVAVPMTALYDLFDMGNYGRGSGDERHVSALDLARNALRHVSIDLEMLGSAATNEDPQVFPEDICSHCYRVAAQLRAALECIDALDAREKARGK